MFDHVMNGLGLDADNYNYIGSLPGHVNWMDDTAQQVQMGVKETEQ